MKLQRSQAEDPELNLTPLIDVVFILLIFFMVSTTFQKESEIQIDLPEAGTTATTDEPKHLEIVIDSNGHYFLGDQQVIKSEFESLLGAIRQHLMVDGEEIDTAMPVTIRADRTTPYESVVRAMDAAAQLGLVKISLTTNQRDTTGK
ncbi:MAG: biopolymer transporter ExbD [Gammaproteobacteria bacterium]